MSQPQLTNFFTHAKRGTRNAGKVLDAPVESINLTPKRTSRGKKVAEELKTPIVEEIKKPKIVKADILGQQDVLKEISENKVVETKKVEQIDEPIVKEVIIEKTDEVVKEKPKRGRKKVEQEEPVKELNKDDCPSPAKRTRRTRSKALDNVIEKAKKLTPAEVKKQLGGKKLHELKDQLKKIEKSSETVKQAKAKSDAAAKKVAVEKAKVQAKEDYVKSPAYISYHNLAVKSDGTLPLPYTYKFLAEVFRCTDTISAMLHNRKEIISVEKMKVAVQQMMRKDFSVSYLKQIKTVFPSAYRYAWENIIGRYGKKLSDFELHMSVNLDYKNEMINDMGGKDEPDKEVTATADRLGPQGMVERKTIFHNSLVNIVKEQHKKFCSELETPLKVEDISLLKFHKDFDVDKCQAIPEEMFPEQPYVEKVTTAAQILEKSRVLFEINPRLSETLAKAAEAKKSGEKSESSEVKVETPKPAPKPIRKELQGLPPKLIEKILAKEAEKAAREMFTDKDREDKIKRLRRLPVIARILKNTFISERKAALPFDIVIKKAVSSYPGHLSSEIMTKDMRYLIEVTKPWAVNPTVQGKEFIKINQTDINTVVQQLEKMLAEEEK